MSSLSWLTNSTDPGGSGNPPSGGGQGGDAFMAAAVVADALIQSNQNKKNRQAARDMAAYQYSKDLEMWHLQNQYNSPEETMRRLKMAGLNPHLIYGKGSDAGGTAREAPKYQAPRPNYTHKIAQLAPLMAMYQGFQKSQAEIDHIKAKKQLDTVKTVTEGSKAVSGQAKAKIDTELAKYSYDLAFAEAAQQQQKTGTMIHQRERAKSEVEIGRYKSRSAASEATIKGVEANLAKKYGMRMGDQIQYRIAAKIAEMLGFGNMFNPR